MKDYSELENFRLKLEEAFDTSIILMKIGIEKSKNKTNLNDSKRNMFIPIIERIILIIEEIYILRNKISESSLISLTRMVSDHYSILYLFSESSEYKYTQLRYYLFLLDSIKSREKYSKDFHKHSEILSDHAIAENANILAVDLQEKKSILEKIKNLPEYNSITNEWIEQNNWKFKKLNISGYYSWEELYVNAQIPKNFAVLIHQYFSSYVHGLGISIVVKGKEFNYGLKITVLYILSIIVSNINLILSDELKIEF